MKHLYISTFILQRKERASDNQGGWVETYKDIGEIHGRLRPANATERTVASQEQAYITHVFYCDATEDIRRGDRLKGEGIEVNVIAVRNPSYMNHHLEIDCEVIQHGG